MPPLTSAPHAPSPPRRSGGTDATWNVPGRIAVTRLGQHPGYAVRSVRCPARARQAKGVVVRCTVTLRNGDVVRVRAAELDDRGTVHLVANEIFADNVQRGILANLPRSASGAQAVCPNHVPVVIGSAFSCRLSGAGALTRAEVTIVDADGGFRLTFS